MKIACRTILRLAGLRGFASSLAAGESSVQHQSSSNAGEPDDRLRAAETGYSLSIGLQHSLKAAQTWQFPFQMLISLPNNLSDPPRHDTIPASIFRVIYRSSIRSATALCSRRNTRSDSALGSKWGFGFSVRLLNTGPPG